MRFSPLQQKNTTVAPAKGSGDKLRGNKEQERRLTMPTQVLHGLGAIPAPAAPPLIVQPKLSINTPGDAYEREADEMAEKVVEMSAKPAVQHQVNPNTLQRKCEECEKEEVEEPEILMRQVQPNILQQKCEECDAEEETESDILMRQVQTDFLQRKCEECNEMEEVEEEEEDSGMLMRKVHNKGGFAAPFTLISQLQVTKGGGHVLPDATKAFMENAFQADFSQVRIHTDARAAEMSHSIHARAFTHGRDIYFNKGEYIPDRLEGKKLLAHELTHTLQQRHTLSKSIQTKTLPNADSGNMDATAHDSPAPPRPASDHPIEPETTVKIEKPEKKVETKGLQEAVNSKNRNKTALEQKSSELKKSNEKNNSKLKETKTEKGNEKEEKDLEKLETVEKDQGGNPVLDKAEQQAQQAVAGNKDSSNVDGKLQLLVTKPLAFSEEEVDQEQIEGIKQANQVANSFFGGLSGQIQGLQGVSAMIQPNIEGASTGVKTNVVSYAETQKQALVTQVTTALTEAQNHASSAKSKVNSDHKSALIEINKKNKSSNDSINTSYKKVFDALEAKYKTQKEAIDKRYSDTDKAYRKSGITVGKEGTDIGEQTAKEYLSHKINQMDSLTDGYLTDRRCEARAKAAREVSNSYKPELEKIGNEQADEALKGKEKDYAELGKIIEEAKKALLAQQTAALKSAEDAATQSTKDADKLKRSLNKSIDSQLKGISGTLNNQKETHVETIEGQKTNQLGKIDKSSTEAISTLSNNLNEGVVKLIDGLLDVKTGLNGKEAPPVEEINEKTSVVGTQIVAGIATTMNAIAEAIVSINEGISTYESIFIENVTTTITAVFEGIKTTGEGFKEGMKTANANAHSSFRDLKKAHNTNSGDIAKKAGEGFEDIAKKIGEGFVTLNTKLNESTTASITEFEKGLRGAFDGEKGMKATIINEAQKAADAEQPAWKSIVKWILIIVIILVVALVIGPAVIAGVGAFLGTGTLATAIVAGAIVGAATSATLQVVNNWADGKPLLEGVGRAALVGAISGAIGGAAGFGLQKAAVEGAKQFVFDQAIGAVVDAGMTIAETGKLPSASEFFTNLGTGLVLSLITLGATKTSRGKSWSTKSESFGTKVGEGLKVKIKPPKVAVPTPHVNASVKPPIAPDAHPSTKPGASATSETLPKPDTATGAQPSEAVSTPPKSQPTAEPTAPKPTQAEPKPPAATTDTPTKPKPDAPESSGKAGAKPKSTDTDTPSTGKQKPTGEADAPVKQKSGEPETAGKPKPGEPEITGKSKQPSVETDAPSGKPKSGDTEAPKQSKPKGDPDTPKKSSHEGHPIDSEGVVAKLKTDDGHEVKVLKDGSVAVCSECGTMRMKYADELGKNKKLKKKLDEIEAMPDPKAKSEAAAKLRKRLENARKIGVPDTDPLVGKDIAKEAGLPKAPEGHEWVRQPDGSLTLRRRASFADKVKLLDYDPDTPKSKGVPKGFKEAERSHLSEREKSLPKPLQDRVSLWESTKAAILKNASKTTKKINGERRWVDEKTDKVVPGDKITYVDGKPIKGDIAFGHKKGDIAWRDFQELHKNAKSPLTRDQVIKLQNDPKTYRVEWEVSNSKAGAKAKVDLLKNKK